mmetsp:Transcript_69739/g.149214  ORF Transcript_69739/g.149214 Transcript_69739/m.149214 type:complete len:221 (-) Transcript_69739:405-1067(-)
MPCMLAVCSEDTSPASLRSHLTLPCPSTWRRNSAKSRTSVFRSSAKASTKRRSKEALTWPAVVSTARAKASTPCLVSAVARSCKTRPSTKAASRRETSKRVSLWSSLTCSKSWTFTVGGDGARTAALESSAAARRSSSWPHRLSRRAWKTLASFVRWSRSLPRLWDMCCPVRSKAWSISLQNFMLEASIPWRAASISCWSFCSVAATALAISVMPRPKSP